MKLHPVFRKLTRLVSSMKFGMILLSFLALFSITGTVLPQGRPESYYRSAYPAWTGLIRIFHLDRVFTSWWFVLLVALLALNLTFCSLRSLPSLLHRMKSWRSADQIRAHPPEYRRSLPDNLSMEEAFRLTGFTVQKSADGLFRARRHNIGWLGSWLTHVGILLIIIFYVFGKWFGFETMVYGIPGSSAPVLETGYTVRFDDFDILYREDYSVHQYLTDAAILDSAGQIVREGVLQVNQPMTGPGFDLFQSGTGWALAARLEKDGQELSHRTLFQSEAYAQDGEDIVLQFMDFYPDFILREGHPYTRSPFPQNPRILYAIYHKGQQVQMDLAVPGTPLRFLNYTFHLESPRLFTVLQAVSDPGIPGVLAGGLLLLAGIFLSFYWIPQEFYGVTENSGASWITATTRRNQALFYEELDRRLKINPPGGTNV